MSTAKELFAQAQAFQARLMNWDFSSSTEKKQLQDQYEALMRAAREARKKEMTER